MTEFEDTRAALSGLFNSGWNNHWPVEWPNQPDRIDRTAPWARFTVIEGERGLAAIGTRFRRTVGLVAVQLFVPLETGTKALSEAAAIAADALELREILPAAGMTIELRAASMTQPRIDGGTYAVTVSVPWRRDMIAAA